MDENAILSQNNKRICNMKQPPENHQNLLKKLKNEVLLYLDLDLRICLFKIVALQL